VEFRRARHAQSLAFTLGLFLAAWSMTQVAAARLLPSVQARTPPQPEKRVPGLPSDVELEKAGARIGEIHFIAKQLFDVEHEDENTTLSRLANRLHIETRESTIRDELLFKSGDAYRVTLLEESERILRDTRYLRDARIRPVAYHDGVVDIEVTTQDVWTLDPGFNFGRKGGKNTAGIKFEELNLFGLGTQVGIAFTKGVDRDSKLIEYYDRQLGSSWWELSTAYSDNSDGRLAVFSLQHPFYALDARWASGVSLVDDKRVDSRYDLGEIIDQFATQEKFTSIYWGWSDGLVDNWVRRFSVGMSYEDHVFEPVTGAHPTRLLPEDRRLVYPWFAAEWVQNAFQTVRNRDQIEKTEDYSLGWSARAQLGYASTAFGSDRDAITFRATLSKGTSLTDRQSLLVDAGLTGRLESGELRGTTLGGAARYYFRQSPRRLFYLDLSSEVGENLDADQQILLGGDSGLRGYPLRYQAGEGRWLFTAEQRFFTNWFPFQLFNVGAAVFYDMGATWGHDPLASPSQGLLRDLGVGLRLGNSRSALGNVLHIDLAFPLDGDPSIKSVQFLVETKEKF